VGNHKRGVLMSNISSTFNHKEELINYKEMFRRRNDPNKIIIYQKKASVFTGIAQ
jgi:hypothetical protein